MFSHWHSDSRINRFELHRRPRVQKYEFCLHENKSHMICVYLLSFQCMILGEDLQLLWLLMQIWQRLHNELYLRRERKRHVLKQRIIVIECSFSFSSSRESVVKVIMYARCISPFTISMTTRLTFILSITKRCRVLYGMIFNRKRLVDSLGGH